MKVRRLIGRESKAARRRQARRGRGFRAGAGGPAWRLLRPQGFHRIVQGGIKHESRWAPGRSSGGAGLLAPQVQAILLTLRVMY